MCKNWLNDPRVACKSLFNLVNLIEKNCKLKKEIKTIWNFIWMGWNCEHMKKIIEEKKFLIFFSLIVNLTIFG